MPPELGQGVFMNTSRRLPGSIHRVIPSSFLASVIFMAVLSPGPLAARYFLRGDADGNGAFDITDAIVTLEWLYLGGEAPPCLDGADFNDDGTIDISDVIANLSFQFLGGPEPAYPGSLIPGTDLTRDGNPELSCDRSLRKTYL